MAKVELRGRRSILRTALLPTPATVPLATELRARRAEVPGLLTGERCRWCGERVGRPRPVGLAFAEGTAARDERAGAVRVCRRPGDDGSSEALADEAEVTMRGEPLPCAPNVRRGRAASPARAGAGGVSAAPRSPPATARASR